MGRDPLSTFVAGQWRAFDRVMNRINTMTTEEDITQDQMRRRIYVEVASMLPEMLEEKKNGKE